MLPLKKIVYPDTPNLLNNNHNFHKMLTDGINVEFEQHGEVKHDIVWPIDFENIEHRLEHVLTVHGIDFINDSKATNVNACWYALESMNKDVIWIAGGVDKGNDYTDLLELVKDKVKAIVCLGNDNKKIHNTFKSKVERIVITKDMRDAVNTAYSFAQKGDAVLLSPACASFDLFKNFEQRGTEFKSQVRQL